jgi:hypothetical protein
MASTVAPRLSKVAVCMAQKSRPRVCGSPRQAEWRLSIIQPIRCETLPRSPERAARIAEVAAATKRDWRGRPSTLGDRTIRDWITRYEAAGFEGLTRKAPRNAGERRVLLSRAWDRAMREAGLSEAAIGGIVAQVRTRVRGEWASGKPSWPKVQLNVLPLVIDLTSKAGLILPEWAMRDVCRLPRRFVEAERHHSNAGQSRPAER